MKKLIFIVLAVALEISAFSQSTDKRFKNLDKELNEVLKIWHLAGFSVAVIEKDKVIYAKGFGYRDLEKQIPVNSSTLFPIGSSSKAFTGALIGQLEDKELLTLNDKPSQHIQGLKFYSDELDEHVTLIDMLSHRTGLPRHEDAWYLFTTDSKDSLLRKIAWQQPYTGIREEWYYNNFMYLGLGVIVEHLTGKSWEENIVENLFRPIDMSNSNTRVSELLKTADRSLGYGLKDDSIITLMDYYPLSGMSPAGGINSNVLDLSNWVMTWIHGGKFKGRQVIPENYVRQAISSQMIISGDPPDSKFPDVQMSNYGFAWFISSYRSHYMVQHGGNIDGFSANVCFFPTDSTGIVILTNQDASMATFVIRNLIADKLFALPTVDWNRALKDKMSHINEAKAVAAKISSEKKISGTHPSHPLKDYAGIYSHPAYGSFEVNINGDSLYIKFPLAEYRLEHFHYDVFKPLHFSKTGTNTSAVDELKFTFFMNEDGEIAGVRVPMEPLVDDIVFKKATE